MTEQAQGQAAPESADTQVEAQPEARTLTQADVKKIAENEKREGKQSAIRELLEKTGAESIDDVIARVQSQMQTESEQETVADKAEKARAKAEERAKAAEERYTTTLREFALRDALRDSGINPDRLKGAMRLADISALEVDGEGNISGLEEVVEAVKEDSPEWFGQVERPRVNAPQTNGTGIQRPGNTEDPERDHANWLLGILNP